MLEALRPQQTVTLCLPLFLAGEEGERRFARSIPRSPWTAARSSARSTERRSTAARWRLAGRPGHRRASGWRAATARSGNSTSNDEEAVWIVADRLAAEVDNLLTTAPQTPALSVVESPNGATGSCGCGQPAPEGSLSVNGTPVVINGLPLIFEHLAKRELEPGAASGETLLETVRVYHAIETGADEAYPDGAGRRL